MPVERCRKNGKPGYRWCRKCKCFTYTPGDKAERERAKRRAEAQGRNIEKGK